MKMKNVFMLLLGAMLVLSMAGVVSAETNPVEITNKTYTEGTKSADVKVTLALSQSFEVTIPADIVMTDAHETGTYSGYDWVNATVHLLNPNTALLVNITSTNVDGHDGSGEEYWNLIGSDSNKLQYIIASTGSPGTHASLTDSSNWISENEQLIYLSGHGVQNRCLHFCLASQLSSANVGTYEDTLTFNVYLVPHTSTTTST